MTIAERYSEIIPLPRAIRFPVEFIPPEGFDPEEPRTWPKVDGRLEYVSRRLLYMPPCGDTQQDTVTDLVITLGSWARRHSGFVVGTNEAGMLLHGDARGADVAVWRRSELGPYRHKYRRVPPLLAVEVAGEDEDEAVLCDKAGWYLSNGVQVVWIVLPEQREVVVITASDQHRFQRGDTIPVTPVLPDLAPRVGDFFLQISAE